jgi:branched-chain amino acid transport system ATP-binding protein
MNKIAYIASGAAADPAPDRPTVEVKGLTAGYGGLAAVRDISFACPAGEILVLIGPNGAGKTTILNAMVGLISPLSGDVQVAGQSVRGLPSYRVARHGIAIIPSTRGICADLTVAEHMRLALRSPSRKSSTARVWEVSDALALFPSLGERRDVRAGNLSGGQQQMLAITTAVMLGPRVLLIDELSMGLAPNLVQEILKVLRQIVDTEGTSIILVEQHYELALAIAEKCVVLNHGEIAFQAPAKEVLQQRARLASVYLAHGSEADKGYKGDAGQSDSRSR